MNKWYRAHYPNFDRMFDRHDNPDYIPPNYPDWSEERWAEVWKQHENAMKAIEQGREEERIQRIEAISRLAATIEAKKVKDQEKIQTERTRISSLGERITSTKAITQIAMNFYQYLPAFSNSEVYFYLAQNIDALRGAPKKSRKLFQSIIALLEGELHRRERPYGNLSEIYAGFASLSPEEKHKLANLEL